MIRLGKTYGNLMVDLRASNTKLADRARRIVRAVTNLSPAESERLLNECGGEVKTAIVSHDRGVSRGRSPATAFGIARAFAEGSRRPLDQQRQRAR